MVAPPPLENDAEEKKGKKSSAKSTRKADAAACGALVGAAFAACSLGLTNGLYLAADEAEEKEIGADLAAVLNTLPFDIGHKIAQTGPWAKLGRSLGTAVLKRVKMVASIPKKNAQTPQQKAQEAAHAQQSAPPFAPNPGNVTQMRRQQGEVFAPQPVSFG